MSAPEVAQETAQEAWDHDRIMAEVEKMFAMGETAPRQARDPINQPMINNWLEAMGETDPRYSDGIAPPAMAQVWTMYGLDPTRPADDPLHGTMQIFDAAGFKSVLGTNCDQTYLRDVKVGEHVSITTRLESVVGPKVTGVGEGYFVSTLNTWWVAKKNEHGGEEREAVATMLFRVLKFKPAARPASGGAEVDKTKLVRPQMNRDTEYFWEGTKVGELRLQKCNACGELRHPPGPMCPTCHAADRGYVVASGRGTVFSFLVHHAPQLPGKELPITLALIELEEGLRMVGEVQGNRDEIAIGAPVRVAFEKIDDELTLAQWEVVK